MKINWSPLPPAGQSVFGFDADTLFTFDRAYIASLPPQVQAIHIGEVGMLDVNGQPTTALDPVARFNLAMDLAQQGFFIDAWIEGYGADPFLTNTARLSKGTLSIESAIGNATKIVSVNPADYPAWQTPVNPTPVPTTMVGPLEFGNLYQLTSVANGLYAAGQLKAGQVVPENGHSYTLLVVALAVGVGVFWQQTA